MKDDVLPVQLDSILTTSLYLPSFVNALHNTLVDPARQFSEALPKPHEYSARLAIRRPLCAHCAQLDAHTLGGAAAGPPEVLGGVPTHVL